MLEIEVSYPDGWHVPSQSKVSFVAIVSSLSKTWKSFSITEIINNIFDEKYETIFGTNDNIIAGQPESVLLTTNNKRWH